MNNEIRHLPNGDFEVKELPMNAHLNRTDLTDTEIELSQLVFAHYHPNPKPGERSSVSDAFARNLRGDEACIMAIATCLAKMVAPEHADKVGQVVGFYVQPARPSGDIVDFLKAMLGGDEPKTGLELLLDQPLVRPSGRIDPYVLWARAYLELQEYCADVTFDHEYTQNQTGSYRPGIHGEGVNLISVNGALLAVLMRENLMDQDYFEFLATVQDDDGWVYSHWDLS